MPLSYSQLSTYRTCPKQYEYAFVQGIERQMSAGESYGVSMHSTLKKWGELEMRYQKEHRTDERLTLFTEEHEHHQHASLDRRTLVNLWRESFVGYGYASRTDQDCALKRGEAALVHFFDWWMQKPRTVLAVEKGFSLNSVETKTVISGRFDRVEIENNQLHIIDFKTGSLPNKSQVDEDLQLSIYALAAENLWQKPVASLSLLSVREEACMELLTTRTSAQLEDAKAAISQIDTRISAQDFAATPSHIACKRCPYSEICSSSLA
ncbi:MAG: PD-(D/E)XK nuclease family protein [Candidatus Peribacteraceae bacterium]